MKYIYIWNDLPLFTGSYDLQMDNDIINILKNIQIQDGILPTYISSNCFNEWIQLVSKILQEENNSDHCILTLGTRPAKAFEKIKPNINIRLKRHIDNAGHTTTANIFEDSMALIKEIASSKSHIIIIEDVLVSGITIKTIFDYLEQIDYKGRVVLFIFYANLETIKKVNLCPRSFAFQIKVYQNMNGKAIDESTLMCIYDLMFGMIGNYSFFERPELLERFFFNHVGELEQIVKKYRNNI